MQAQRSEVRPLRATALSTDGRTIYAIGDIHGRVDLLDALLAKIDADVAAPAGPQPRATTDRAPTLVLLGDYIDRGPDSRRVVDRILALRRSQRFELIALRGNHEASLLEFLEDPSLGPAWTSHGGMATLASYNVPIPHLRTEAQAWLDTRDALLKALPESHSDFYSTLGLMSVIGDYAFVHAGVRPGIPLDRQPERDLLWIRDDFLASTYEFEKVIVHGHTPEVIPSIGRLRIGIDTGAYATGVLTAVRLSGGERRFLQTGVAARSSPSGRPNPVSR